MPTIDLTFEYDPPTGVYKSKPFSEKLRRRAAQPGPVLHLYAPVIFSSLKQFQDENLDATRVLVYQLRALRHLMPDVEPELRAAICQNFGREKYIAWYDPAYEGVLLDTGGRGVPKPIDPAEVL